MLEVIRRRITDTENSPTNTRQDLTSLSTLADRGDRTLPDFTAERSGDASTGESCFNPTVNDVFFGSDINYGDWLDFFE